MTRDTSHPRVSVLLPVHNGQRYLREAIGSILTQTYEDFELLVIDDGSTDRSAHIAAAMANEDVRVVVRSQSNTGIVGALNGAIGLARGKYLARMDADDISLPMRLETQVAYLDCHSDCVLVGTQIEHMDPHGLPLRSTPLPLTHEQIDAQLMHGFGGAIAHPACMMRARAVQQVGGYRKAFDKAEDLDLFLRLAEVGRVVNVESVLLRYRVHAGSANAKHYQTQLALKRRILAEAHARRGTELPGDWQADEYDPSIGVSTYRWWAWNALKHRHRALAWRYALRAALCDPLATENARLLACCIRGH